MPLTRSLQTLSFFLVLFFSPTLLASWTLDGDSSELNFSFIKNTHLAATSEFTQLAGTINDNRKARVTIYLGSLRSGIHKRDKRLKEQFFEVERNPTAQVEMLVYKSLIQKVEQRGQLKTSVTFNLTLNAIKKRMNADVYIAMSGSGELNIFTLKPVMLDASQFGLTDKVQMLVSLAGVNNISYMVPVSFHLKFLPDPVS